MSESDREQERETTGSAASEEFDFEPDIEDDRTRVDEVFDSARQILMAGLGAAGSAGERSSELFQRLVEKGERYEQAGRVAADELRRKTRDELDKVRDVAGENLDRARDSFDDRLIATLERLEVVRREDLAQVAELESRVRELERRLETLEQESTKSSTTGRRQASSSSRRKTSAKKTTTRRKKKTAARKTSEEN